MGKIIIDPTILDKILAPFRGDRLCHTIKTRLYNESLEYCDKDHKILVDISVLKKLRKIKNKKSKGITTFVADGVLLHYVDLFGSITTITADLLPDCAQATYSYLDKEFGDIVDLTKRK